MLTNVTPRFDINSGKYASTFGSSGVAVSTTAFDDVILDYNTNAGSVAASLAVNGTKYVFAGSTSWSVIYGSSFLFALRNNDGNPAYFNGCRVSEVQMTSYGILIRSYVPCIRKIDSVAGMYDTVNGTFSVNAGTGSFIAGPTVNEYIPVPRAYQRVEYLESTGTQHIDTGVAPNIYTTDLAFDCATLAINNRVWGAGETIGGVAYSYKEYTTAAGVVYLGADSGAALGHAIGDRAVISVVGGVAYNNGVAKKTYTGVDVTLTRSLHLFGELQGVAPGTVVNGLSRVYGGWIKQSSVLVRNYVPCIRKTDSVAGMYDVVNGVFYTNQGTGNFIVGPNVD